MDRGPPPGRLATGGAQSGNSTWRKARIAIRAMERQVTRRVEVRDPRSEPKGPPPRSWRALTQRHVDAQVYARSNQGHMRS
jgi:hypothetical protein